MIEHEIISPDVITSVKVFDFKSKHRDRMIPPHWHDSIELLYCLSGELQVWLGPNNKGYLLEEGDLLLINSNDVHSSQSPSANHVIVVQLPLAYLDKITDGTYNTEWVFQLNTLLRKQPEDQSLRVILRGMLDTIAASNLVGKFTLKAKMYELLAVLVQSYQQKRVSQPKLIAKQNQQNMAQIMSYVQLNFKEDMSVSEVAKLFNYSESYFSKLFKKHVGMNFTDYVASIRIDYAHNLLLSSDWRIIDIALDSGFNNPRTFYSAFEKIYQQSPSVYRKKMTENFRK